MIRTKILATMGPAVASVETLVALFKAGCDVCRLNFSHGTLADHLKTLRTIREASLRHDHPIAVLGDLCGPKIRLGKVSDIDGTGGMPIHPGDELILQRQIIVGGVVEGTRRASSNYAHLVDDVQVGQKLLIEDGLLRFLCTDKTFNELRLQCVVGGVLKSNKGVNLPNSKVGIASITEYDWECVAWAVENDLDYLALSFVRSADDIKLLQQDLRNKRSDIHIIAKIEKAEAIVDLDAIIASSHGIMVARGDLGVEMDVAEVPILQKKIIAKCQQCAKPVIVATQMLQSMIEQASPTRAEVSDVANAILDGTDAVMLSGETSVGKFPVGAVLTMAHIADTTEKYQVDLPSQQADRVESGMMQLSSAIGSAVARLVAEMKVELVVVYSQSGATARVFSKHRLPVPIIALSSDHKSLRQMALHFGVVPMELPPPASMDDLIDAVDQLLHLRGLAVPGQRIVVAAGASLGTPGTRNAIIIHTIGSGPTSEISI
jgi:pyruvate kinase